MFHQLHHINHMGIYMAFSKNEMQSQLLEFMQGYASSIERLYGGNISETLSNTNLITNSYLWNAVSEMYDYGVLGIPLAGFGNNQVIDGIHADCELFLNCLSSGAMDIYLYEDEVIFPYLSYNAMATAIARHVLEGGERFTDYGAGEHGIGNGDWGYLTLREIAFLADMDERSVRNAANPKVNDPLKTESIGKRSLVTPQEAKRWLAGRKGFAPTQLSTTEEKKVVNKEISLPGELIDLLNIKAENAGLSLAEFIKQVL